MVDAATQDAGGLDPQAVLNAQLIDAVKRGKETTVLELLSAGANPNTRELGVGKQNYVLHLASTIYSPTIMMHLLRAGADIDVTNDADETVLHMAAEAGASKSVEILLLRGADHTLKDKDGNTALHLAVSGHDSETISALLRGGAQVQVTNNAGLNVLQAAKREGNAALAVLEEEISKLGRALIPAFVPAGTLDKAALFDPKAPDWALSPKNIGFWQQFETIATRLAEQGEPLTVEDLHYPDGMPESHLLNHAARFFKARQVLCVMAQNELGPKLDDFILPDGKPREFLQKFSELGCLHQIFSGDIWSKRNVSDLRRCHKAFSELMPERMEAQVHNYPNLLQSIAKQPSPGRSR